MIVFLLVVGVCREGIVHWTWGSGTMEIVNGQLSERTTALGAFVVVVVLD
jgi:hypothetical protein